MKYPFKTIILQALGKKWDNSTMEGKIGRPSLNLNHIESIVHKLEPYLKRGFSIRKACYMAQIPHSSVYELIENNTDFSDRIELFKQYKSILLSDIILIK